MTCRRWCAIIVAFLLLVACGIDRDLKREAKTRQQDMQNARSRIETNRDKYMAWKDTPEFEPFARYEATYGWPDQYAAALAEIDSAKAVWNEIEQILDANQPEDEGKLRSKIIQLRRRLAVALQKSRQPNSQIRLLSNLMADAPSHIAKAEAQVAEMKSMVAEIRPLADQATADSKTHSWNKEEDIAERFNGLKKIHTDAREALGRAKAQTKATDTNYAIIADGLHQVEQQRDAMEKSGDAVKQRLGELNRSYTKRLIDMKHVYTVTIGRTSWDNYYDYPRETNFIYPPRPVDQATFEYLAKQTGDIASGLYRPRPRIPQNMWRSLNIDSDKRAPQGDDSAVFWVNDWEILYYHRYRIIENGQKRETDWEAVDEDVFAENIDNMGMDILSKPYGMYADEAMQAAMPPGMAFVGNKQYGRWQQDSAGNRFWAFYGRYAFLNAMLGGNRYYYNDWDRWRRDYRGRTPYYGKNTDGSTIYGTNGSMVRNDPNYRSSTFARQGGIKAAPANIRSAAGGVRGRGPGSRGK